MKEENSNFILSDGLVIIFLLTKQVHLQIGMWVTDKRYNN